MRRPTKLKVVKSLDEKALDPRKVEPCKFILERLTFNDILRKNCTKNWNQMTMEFVDGIQCTFIFYTSGHSLFYFLYEWIQIVNFAQSRKEALALTFSSPEPTILLVCARDRDLWQGPKQEVRESRTSGFCAQPQKFEQ